MKKLFILLIFNCFAVSNVFAGDDSILENPVGCAGCPDARMMVGAGSGFPRKLFNKNYFAYVGWARNNGKYSTQTYLKYSQSTQVISSRDYIYQKLELPVALYWNPTNHISVGGGIQGETVLKAMLDGKALNLNQEFKKYGFGTLVGAEIGAKNRGPRLGVHYTQHFGAGSTLGKSYGTLELSLRVQIW